jgi:hypothetical protein
MAKVVSTIKVPVALAEDGGSLQGFVWNQIVRGHKPAFGNDLVILHGLDANEQPSFADLVAIVTGGGYFEGVKFGIQFTSGVSANRIVPSIIRGSTYVDENEVVQEHTWLSFLKANNADVIRHTSGAPYVVKANIGTQIMNSDELTAANAQSGINVIEFADLQARNSSVDYEPFEIP